MYSLESADKFGLLKYRLALIELLKLLKREYSYRELSRITGVPETVLCRYVKGSMIPSLEQAARIWNTIERHINIKRIVSEKVRVTRQGYVDVSDVISDPYFLKLFGYYVFTKFMGRGVTKILTAAAGGIPLATSVALIMDVPLVIAKTHKEDPELDYIEETSYSPYSTITTFFVRRDFIKRRDVVLIVDDFLRSGKTLRALCKIAAKVKARVIGAVALVSVGNQWRGIVEPTITLYHLERPFAREQ